ncbi:MAG: beta-lactamase hydrolase domain-containing protein [Planctomycetota bacterium]
MKRRLSPLALACLGSLLAACGSAPSADTDGGPVQVSEVLPPYVEVPRFKDLAPGVAGGGQPTLEAIRALAERGYTTLINLRTDPELLGGEAETAQAAGLRYVRIPVSGSSLSLADAARLREILLESRGGPVFIHCASGNRVGGIWGLYRALTEGLTPRETEQAARRAGLRSDALAERVRSELEFVRD